MDGTESLDTKYKVTRQFPNQNRPNSYSWKFWKKVLSTFTVTNKGIELSKCLGNWTENHRASGIWDGYFCDQENLYYKKCIVNGESWWDIYTKKSSILTFEDQVLFCEVDIKE